MHRTLAAILAASVVAGVGASANAEIVNVTITADNHYALYSSQAGVFTYHGGNELGAGGAPGTYNWSIAENHTFNAGNILYIAAWSDDSVAQGVMAQFQSDSLGTLLSGDSRWEVYATNINRGDGDPHPAALDIFAHVLAADFGNAWEDIYVGDANGANVDPWGTIAGIDNSARWMWKNVPGDNDPTRVGSGAGEMLIFRIASPIPTPATATLLGLGGLTAFRRRR